MKHAEATEQRQERAEARTQDLQIQEHAQVARTRGRHRHRHHAEEVKAQAMNKQLRAIGHLNRRRPHLEIAFGDRIFGDHIRHSET